MKSNCVSGGRPVGLSLHPGESNSTPSNRLRPGSSFSASEMLIMVSMGMQVTNTGH